MVAVSYVENISDEYELGAVLGEGTYGKVLCARRKNVNKKRHKSSRNCVLKIVEIREDCIRELDHLISTRKCFRVLRINAAVLTQDKLCMEFDRGECTLWNHIKRRPEDMTREQVLTEALDFTAKILTSLVHIHDRGIAHRDLKSDNIMILRDDNGETLPWIIDFGMSK